MHNHASENYQCPICLAVEGVENGETMIKQTDIFFKDEQVMAFISSKFDKNGGHPLIVPIKHYENLYDLPTEIGARIFDLARQVALAVKETTHCDGITAMQNNEPAGDQHAFHYHFHIYPRYSGDELHSSILDTRVSSPEERVVLANSLRSYLEIRDK
ncbi:MAG: hypothetical protein ACD_61C00042G0009 [uncultured bacterium]|nr:MAG: hypothetical protein ACD_61C00042G0009 [uncultured bacterium]